MCTAMVIKKTAVKIKRLKWEGAQRRFLEEPVGRRRWCQDCQVYNTELVNAYAKNIIQVMSYRRKPNVILNKGKQFFRWILVSVVNVAQKVLWKKWCMVLGHDPLVQPFLVFSSFMKGLRSVKYCHVLPKNMLKKEKYGSERQYRYCWGSKVSHSSSTIGFQKRMLQKLHFIPGVKQGDGQGWGKALHFCCYRWWPRSWRSVHACVLQAVVTSMRQEKGEIKTV